VFMKELETRIETATRRLCKEVNPKTVD